MGNTFMMLSFEFGFLQSAEVVPKLPQRIIYVQYVRSPIYKLAAGIGARCRGTTVYSVIAYTEAIPSTFNLPKTSQRRHGDVTTT